MEDKSILVVRGRVTSLALSTMITSFGFACFVMGNSKTDLRLFFVVMTIMIAVLYVLLLSTLLCKSNRGKQVFLFLFLLLSSLLPPAILLIQFEIFRR